MIERVGRPVPAVSGVRVSVEGRSRKDSRTWGPTPFGKPETGLAVRIKA